jgi:hypothetical protein
MSLTGLMCMIGLGGSTSIAYWLWGGCCGLPGAGGAVRALVPFVGSAASSVVFGETFGPLRLAGMVVVAALPSCCCRSAYRASENKFCQRSRGPMSHSLLIAFIMFARDVLRRG